MDRTKIIPNSDIEKYIKTPTEILSGYKKEVRLNKYVSVPSTVHGYSLAIEYMRDWILSQYQPDFFKTVHVNGKHVLEDYRHFDRKKYTAIIKPAIAIVPSLNADYDRDNVDLIQGGLNIYTRRSRQKVDTFFNDDDNNLYIAVQMKQIEMPFTFRIRVKSKAQQLEMLEYTRLACRIGSTQTHFVDIDCHVPYDIMIALAIDLGFELIEDKNGNYHVKDVVSFLAYLNAHSYLPFTYKLRTINGKCEYFIRLKGCHVHISCLDGISVDDGERQGSLESNFHVEFTATLLFTVPAIFSYYSMHEHNIKEKELDNMLGMYQIVSVKPPVNHPKGWKQYLSTQWVDDDRKLTTIGFDSLIDNIELKRVIAHTVTTGLSPALFMDIIIYNAQREIPINIDWEHYQIIINREVPESVSDIAIYADLEYINSTLVSLDNLQENRLKLNDYYKIENNG